MLTWNYLTSEGTDALLAAQRTCKRYNRGELVLAAVPERMEADLESKSAREASGSR